MRGKKIGSDGRNHSDGDGAAHGVSLLGQVASGGFEFVQDGASAREKCLASFGKAYRAAEAVEETSAEFVFQLTDLLG